MTTDELIKALLDLADECEDRKLIVLLDESADRLVELDERVAIMTCLLSLHWSCLHFGLSLSSPLCFSIPPDCSQLTSQAAGVRTL